MPGSSKIEWTDFSWNPVTGCTKISPGCKNCYAERMAKRLLAMGQPNYVNGFALTLQPHMLEAPLMMKKPRMIFVNSMSDLFHKDVPFSYIEDVFDVMRRASWHIFQVLTKRDERLAELANSLCWPKNVWMGVSVESQEYVGRIDSLRHTPAQIKFLSMEPLLSSVGTVDLSNIDWVIVGGESGPRARPMEAEWVREIHSQCIKSHTPFFFKQWGGVRKKKAGRLLDGSTWDEMPEFSFQETKTAVVPALSVG